MIAFTSTSSVRNALSLSDSVTSLLHQVWLWLIKSIAATHHQNYLRMGDCTSRR